ncbi:hypothetical protein QYE76_005628 [Lolium multiflorum]|uniref:Integrase catalytic domain-containing protein n=1 Tax=Lolium multiflorum TaxID=4521 RepID=A0AAD8RUA2_LOLMU|nr:hypothetical protein QYE76_005628 [Lolium multiflorum]
MIINEDNEYETGDDVDPNAPEDDDYDSDGVDAFPSEARTIGVSQRALNVQPSASTQRCNLFQTKALVGLNKACKVIIVGGSCCNLASKELCAKLKLKYLPHPHPYYIQWLSDNGEMKESYAGGLMGHFGREKTLLMLADHFYWPKMRRDVDRYVKRCITCNKSKSKLKPHVYELLLKDALEKAGTKLLFGTTCHPQTDGQTEVVNRTLSQLLRSMIKKNLKEWEDCLPHVEFAYNRAVHSTTEQCPFEVVYGFKPITPLDLLPLPIHERVNMEASKRADFVRKIHVKTKELIEKKGKRNAARMNKKRKEMLFKPGDMVWVHFRKDRYEEEASIARGGEEQLDKKMDVKLDMELDMKKSHGRAREEREECAREEEEVQAGPRPGQTGRHAGAPGPRSGLTRRQTGRARRRPDPTLVPTGHYPVSPAP